jgi:hypothetical protein
MREGRCLVSDELAEAATRLRLALDLFEAGEAMKRAQLRREHPEAPEAEIESLLLAWLRERPGAEHGDAAGRPIAWPRPPR